MMKLLTAALLSGFRPFEPGKAGWKTVKAKAEDGTEFEAVALKEGNPIWIEADGTERTLGSDTITRLNGEAASHRKRAEDAENKYKPFEGLDPAAARGALETVSKLDQKKLIDAGEVDKLKDSMRSEFKSENDKLLGDLNAAREETNGLRRATAFGGSKFIGEKLAIPSDIVESVFGKNFKIEEGKLVGYYNNGDKITSKAKIGEFAEFDEALGLLVDQYPNKNSILKGGGHGGSGNNGGGGGGTPGKARYSMSEYEKLPPAEQRRIGLEAGQGKAEIVEG